MEDYILERLPFLGAALAIIVATFVVALLTNRFFKRLIRKSAETLQNDPTNYQFLRHAIVGLIYILGFSLAIYALPSMRALASSILAGAGILAVAIGFASQQALSNIISGVFIIIFKPFRVNDRVKLGAMSGVVEDISLRHTVIKDLENRRILVPNAVISDEIIINSDFGDQRICKWIEFGISYDSDIDLAKRIMREEIMAHPLLIDGRNPVQLEKGDPIVMIRLVALVDSAVSLRAWAWANNTADAFVLNCDVLESIKKRFDAEGIEIPFPHRTLVFKDKQKGPVIAN